MFKNIYQKVLIIILLSASSYACAEKDKKTCYSNNVLHQADCIKHNNINLQSKLNLKNNKNQQDYNKWMKDLKNKCEGTISFSSGEGIGLIKEQCYSDGYKERIKYLDNKVKQKDKNSDDLEITYLPYNSQDHLKCLESNSKDSCQSVNLISSNKLTHAYSFINSQYGRGVVLPESSDGKLIVISPFSDEGETFLNINIVDKFGVVTEKNLSGKTKFIIDKNYNLIYVKNGKTIKEKL
ncbi:hypothetical protein [Acinetobacter sp. ANC 3832]|uniref:hypothetical protein n=1 Tax=Acinetobacter sp. ANC 3832 TaxID=1977874 RepID=UPI000A356C33|nr:hypothetical protein [Acinetobacter sp. ANC 3832]OTG96493.1 hypothetical protein B9T35_02170 [Acinetobacter sp. ANC 3832]